MNVFKIKLTGAWKEALGILGDKKTLHAAIDHAVMAEAELARRKIVKGMTDQAPGGSPFQPLSDLTLASRRFRKFRGKKILIVTANMRNSIKAKRVRSGIATVGVAADRRTANGKLLSSVWQVQEYGATIAINVTPKMRRWFFTMLRKTGAYDATKATSGSGNAKNVWIVKIPPRPFLRPVFEEIQNNRSALQARLAKRVAAYMRGSLGRV